MDKVRAFKLIDRILLYALEINTPEQLKATLGEPEFVALKSRLASIVGISNSEEELPSPLDPFYVKDGLVYKDGKPFKFVGFNMREFAYYNRYPFLEYADQGYMRPQLDYIKSVGAKVVRFYAAHHTLDNVHCIERTKQALDLILSYGLYAIVVLTDDAYSGFHVNDTPANRVDQGYTHAFFAGGFRENYLPFVNEITTALADHPAIFSWEVGNEFHTPHPPDPTVAQCENILNFFKETSNLIVKNSPKKMVSTGLESCWQLFVLQAYDGEKFADKLYAHPNIHVATWHTYQSPEVLGAAFQHITRELQLKTKVAFLVEETGIDLAADTADWLGGLWKALANRISGMMQWGLSALYRNNFGVGDGMFNHDGLWDQGRRWHNLNGFWRAIAEQIRMLWG